MADTTRSFTVTLTSGKVANLTIRKPTVKEQETAQMEFSRAFTDALGRGLKPQARLLNDARKTNYWTEADDAEIDQLVADAQPLEALLKADKFESPEARTTVRREHLEIIAKIRSKRNEVDAILSHSCEFYANRRSRDFVLTCVIEHAGPKKQKFWPSTEALREETDQGLLNRVYYEREVLEAGLPSNYDEDLKDTVGVVENAVTTPAPLPTDAPAADPVVPSTPAEPTQVVAPPAVDPAPAATNTIA